jgi:FkbM family methyltransferase
MKEFLIEKITKLAIMMEYPLAWKARKAGCYFELYSQIYRLYARGIKPATILDIGANRGMFSRCSNFIFPETKIIAFEPLHDCFMELTKLKKTITNFECYNIAISDQRKDSVIHRSNYDYSSSLLEMGEIHKNAFPYSAEESLEKINVDTLDDVFLGKHLKTPILIKIDVQGNEGYVLEGAKNLLKQTDYIICEISFVPLYKGQMLFDDLYYKFLDLGFHFSGQLGELKHPKTKEVLQIDALFLR